MEAGKKKEKTRFVKKIEYMLGGFPYKKRKKKNKTRKKNERFSAPLLSTWRCHVIASQMSNDQMTWWPRMNAFCSETGGICAILQRMGIVLHGYR